MKLRMGRACLPCHKLYVQVKRGAKRPILPRRKETGIQGAVEVHQAIWVRKEMVNVPVMKLKFNLHMTRWQTRPHDEDIVVERYESLVANPPNRLLSCFFSREMEVWPVGASMATLRRERAAARSLSTGVISFLKLLVSTQMGSGMSLGMHMWAQHCKGFKRITLDRAQKALPDYLHFVYAKEASPIHHWRCGKCYPLSTMPSSTV